MLIAKSANWIFMAKSRFEYVRDFELNDKLLKNCWIVIRIDGSGFSKYSTLDIWWVVL